MINSDVAIVVEIEWLWSELQGRVDVVLVHRDMKDHDSAHSAPHKRGHTTHVPATFSWRSFLLVKVLNAIKVPGRRPFATWLPFYNTNH